MRLTKAERQAISTEQRLREIRAPRCGGCGVILNDASREECAECEEATELAKDVAWVRAQRLASETD